LPDQSPTKPHAGDDWLVVRPIAHRGLHDKQRGIGENSLAAFAAARQAGVPFETDLQITGDDEIVIGHDRIDPSLTAAQLGLPRLREVLDVVAGQVPMLLELKDRGIGSRLETQLMRQLAQYHGEYAVCSFNPSTLVHLRRLGFSHCLGQSTGKLSSAPWLVRKLGRSQMINFVSRPDFLVCEQELLPSAPVGFWRRRGLPVLVWTVRSPDEERRAREFGDNVIFSGYSPQTGKEPNACSGVRET
jgi:glycerophosphoryl diester phosphodiesterase